MGSEMCIRDSVNYFNQPLNNWNVSNVTNMYGMFNNAESFNQLLNNWNVSNVKDMRLMFSDATSFNQPLNNWNVSNVEDMSPKKIICLERLSRCTRRTEAKIFGSMFIASTILLCLRQSTRLLLLTQVESPPPGGIKAAADTQGEL